jgi:hypothetical protein
MIMYSYGFKMLLDMNFLQMKIFFYKINKIFNN